MKVIGVIPCRYQSSRFPGKPLALICGKPMVYHVWNRARKAALLEELLVATDDRRIQEVCSTYDIKTVMTSDKHMTGTDRVGEVAQKTVGEVFVNIQGDEPLIDPAGIDAVVKALLETGVEVTNGYAVIRNRRELNSENVVKVITTPDGMALAFSRSVIPHSKDPAQVYKKQLGLYAFRREAILRFSSLPRRELEIAESIDMYRFLENGCGIRMVAVPESPSIPVDEPEDIPRVEQMMKITR